MRVADVEVTRAGEAVSVSLGDRIVVVLDEQSAGTGYGWALSRLPDFLDVEADSLEPGRDAAPGAVATRRIVLRARDRGTSRVRLELRRSWEQDRPPADAFEFLVTAEG
jgi:predicted secreted protein